MPSLLIESTDSMIISPDYVNLIRSQTASLLHLYLQLKWTENFTSVFFKLCNLL